MGCYIANEGTGIALNIRTCVEINGIRLDFGNGLQVRVLRAGEAIPPRDSDSGQLTWRLPLFVVQPRAGLPQLGNLRYWASFETVFGERFETFNPSQPEVPAIFRRVS